MNIYIHTEWYIFKYGASSDYSNSKWIRIPYHNKELDLFYGDYREFIILLVKHSWENLCQEFHIRSSYAFTMFNPGNVIALEQHSRRCPGEYKRPVVNFKELFKICSSQASLNLLVFVQPCVSCQRHRLNLVTFWSKSGDNLSVEQGANTVSTIQMHWILRFLLGL